MSANTFFTADTHFGHHNVIKFCNRPWQTVGAMNQGLVDRWNAKVGLNDLVYHLGDIVFRDMEVWIPKLRGRIILIKGNHDKQPSKLLKHGISEIFDYKEIKIADKNIIMFHYPIENWNKRAYGSIHLHGHCHGSLRNKQPNRMDVGVDCNNWEPLEIEEVFEKINSQRSL